MEIEPLTFPGVDPKRPMIIAGPCSAESREQVLKTASELAARGVKIFRAGIWKPRTKPGGFEGIGVEGLPWMKQVKQETGMLVATEVATPAHVFEALKAGIDILWVGARTVTNPFAMQELADALKGVDIPILVKNPVNPDLELWVGAIERLYNAGLRRLGVIHRGFSSYEKKIYRNAPLWHIPIELRRRYPNLTIFCDPSHIGGKRELVAPISQQALDLNPFNEDACILKGSLLITKNLLDEAIVFFDEAIEIKPDFAKAYAERGRAKNLKGDKEGAFEDLKKSIELNPEGEEAKKFEGQHANFENKTYMPF